MSKEVREFSFNAKLSHLVLVVVLAAALGSSVHFLVDSLHRNIVMPSVGHLVGGINLEGKAYALSHNGLRNLEGKSEEEIERLLAKDKVVRWGKFITEFLSFIVIMLMIYIATKILMKVMNVRFISIVQRSSNEETSRNLQREE